MATVKCCDCTHADTKRVCADRCTRYSCWVPMFGDPCSEFNVNDECLQKLLYLIKEEYNHEGSIPKTRRR